MKMAKTVALMGMGAGAYMLIEKFKKPAMQKIDIMLEKTNDALDKMM